MLPCNADRDFAGREAEDFTAVAMESNGWQSTRWSGSELKKGLSQSPMNN